MFERFTPQARQVVVRAQEQARDLGHDYIGTEHILLGLVELGDDPVITEVLAPAGVTHEAVSGEILGLTGRGENAPQGHIPFTPRSKKVLELSLREALRLKHKEIHAGHILLGLIREGEGLAVQILVQLGADLPRLREEVQHRLGRGSGRMPRLGTTMASHGPTTPGGAVVAGRAVALAGSGYVGSQHYLQAILADENSVAAKALASLGITRNAVERALSETSPLGTTDELPERAGARRTSLELLGDTIAVRIEESELAARLRPHFERLRTDVLRGGDLPGFDRIWKAVRPAVEHAVREMETSPTPDVRAWKPPGWSATGVAVYTISSRPGGTVGELWTNDARNEPAARAFLIDWFTGKPPVSPAGHDAVFLTVTLDVGGHVNPRTPLPEALTVAHWSSGEGPAPSEWPRVPLSELVAAAIEDLSSAEPGQQQAGGAAGP
jgi:ATP-dependent Clp protease ATP-binding subunit ClpA